MSWPRAPPMGTFCLGCGRPCPPPGSAPCEPTRGWGVCRPCAQGRFWRRSMASHGPHHKENADDSLPNHEVPLAAEGVRSGPQWCLIQNGHGPDLIPSRLSLSLTMLTTTKYTHHIFPPGPVHPCIPLHTPK